jgi:hypothetical protein
VSVIPGAIVGDDSAAVERRELETWRLASALSYAVLLGGVATIAVALYLVVVSYSCLPYWDGWDQVYIAASGGNPLSPAWLWQQHNEHRLVIPKLFLAVDLRLFSARQVFLLASIFVIQLLHWTLLSWSMRVLGGWRGPLWRTGVGLAAFCLFCPAQWENLVWGFQVCFVLPQLFASLSFVSLLLYWTSGKDTGRPAPRFLVVSILAAVGASYSLSSGNLLWPLLIAAALYLKLRRSAVLSLLITGTVSTACYLYRYARPEGHADPLASVRAPLTMLKYWLAYFASSWTHANFRFSPGELTVLVGFGIVIIALLLALPYVRAFRPFAIQLVFTMLFCAATALITALGRLNFGVGQAMASRYQTVALLFWCCLGLLLLGATFSRPRMRYSFLVAQVCLLAIFARGAVFARYTIRAARDHRFQLDAAGAALLTQVYHREQLEHLYPWPDYVLGSVPYMREQQLSIFSRPLASQVGRPLASLFPLVSSYNCTGALESVTVVAAQTPPGLRIAGWARDINRGSAPREVVAVVNGVISGVAAVGDWRQVRSGDATIKSGYFGFTGYVPDAGLKTPLHLYAILDGHHPAACPLETN